uniref:Pinin/SDK/MemA protein domain-containing protein n=1 Tax=Ditylenchus dipsaci TaxID=166011 RepID=A0A915DQZ5_9BILA
MKPRPDKEHKGRSDIRSPVIRRKKEEKGHDQNAIKQKEAARNQRMFGNLLGTLKEFQKQTENGKDTAQDLANKRREIEKRLEEDVKRVYRLDYVDYRAEAEKAELAAVRIMRERAITQYAEEKENHLRRLQHFIKTRSKPTLFYIPAKHNDRTAQLLKESADKMEDLIKVRRDEMRRELSGKKAVGGLDISPLRSEPLKAPNRNFEVRNTSH